MRQDALDILKKYWGYPAFRPMQEEIISSVLAGRDTLGLMPTGGGKSITFQVPGMLLPGLTIVVTPLISLMKDQVDALLRRHIRAVFYHSAMTAPERRKATEMLTNGRAKFLYVSPERLRNERFLDLVRTLSVSLLVVDEAHCISQWGYDFRPSYLNIAKLRKVLPGTPVLALTATATPQVARDICDRLEMQDRAIFRMSFVRSNISYLVRPAAIKLTEVLNILQHTEGSAIVYVRSRQRTGEIAEILRSAGISAENYHAGLRYDEKEERQNRWQRGETRVVVATNAFGMGIDKPDVRVVIHHDIPPSLEEYYQEAGRAGRDGLHSWAVLLTGERDAAVLRRRVSEAFPPRDVIRKIYERVCNYLRIALEEGYESLHDFDTDLFCRTFGYQDRQVRAALHLLGQAGYMEYIEEADRRSRVMILCTREELYHLHEISPTGDRVLSAILRLYTGLFTNYTTINEEEIARELTLQPEDVYQALLELARHHIVSYVPRSRTPQIYLPTSREEPQYIGIGRAIYEDRKEILSRRVEAMIDYAFSDHSCRENRMLAYFGERSARPCGRCDVCREQQSNPKSEERQIKKQMALIVQYMTHYPDIGILELEQRLGVTQQRMTVLISRLVEAGYPMPER